VCAERSCTCDTFISLEGNTLEYQLPWCEERACDYNCSGNAVGCIDGNCTCFAEWTGFIFCFDKQEIIVKIEDVQMIVSLLTLVHVMKIHLNVNVNLVILEMIVQLVLYFLIFMIVSY